MASISEVAKKAGVGVGTVSRVLNGTGYVAEKTKLKVEAAIKELHYVPNELARNLTNQKSHMIAVIVPDISNMFFAQLVNELEVNLRELGYKTLLCNCNGEKTNEQSYLELLDRNLADGVITASSLLRNSKYAALSKPVVSIDSILSPDIPMVCADHRAGGELAANMLIEAGCRNVLQFRDSVNNVIRARGTDANITVEHFPYALRHVAFEETIRAAGIEYHEIFPYEDGFNDPQKSAAAAYEIYPDIDGFMATDIPAVFFAREILKHGKRIPEDVKIIAYDGTPLAGMFYPNLGAIIQPVPEIAKLAVELLMKRINDEPVENMRNVLPVEVRMI